VSTPPLPVGPAVISPTRLRLIETAYELFGRNGFHAVGLDQIIAAVGVTKTTFYNHFESKDDLILAVIAHRHAVETHEWTGLIREIGGLSPRRQLDAIFPALRRWLDTPDFRGCIFITAGAEFPAATDPVHCAAAAHLTETRDFFRDLADAAGADAPDDLADQLLLLVEGCLVVRHLTGQSHATDVAEQTARELLQRQLPASA
jgi:AcrR family transcriptional regulator